MTENEPNKRDIEDQIRRLEQIQISFNVSPTLGRKVLEAVVRELESKFSLESVRAHVMLPVDPEFRAVVYHFGMDEDGDKHLILPTEAGCTGVAFTSRSPTVANMHQAVESFREWQMTEYQQSLIRNDRKAMVAVPIFDLSFSLPTSQQTVSDFPVLGTLSVDTATPFEQTAWGDSSRNQPVLNILLVWADVFAKILV